MPEKGRQDESVAGLVVKEAVGRAMETEFRDQIVEAVDAAEGRGSRRTRIPLAGALVSLGVGVGYLLGRSVEPSLEDADATGVIDTMVGKDEADTEMAGSEPDEPTSGGRGRLLATMALVAGAVAGLEFLRRRRTGDDEWEPIEEFEPAADADFGLESEEPNGREHEMDGREGDEAQATASEPGDSSDEDDADEDSV